MRILTRRLVACNPQREGGAGLIIFAIIIIIDSLLLLLGALSEINDLPTWQKVTHILDFVTIVVCVIAMLVKAGQI